MLGFLAVFSLLLAVVVARKFLRLGGRPLDWETGRRRARQPFKKSSKVYECFGVQSAEEYYINSRGVELFCKQWVPFHGAPRAVLFYCHGYGDTCTHVFEDVAIKLASQQFAVVSMDYEGHGMSAGLHCYIRKFSHLVDDVTVRRCCASAAWGLISEEMMPPPTVVAVLKVLARVVPAWRLVPTKDITEVGFRDPEKRQLVRNNPTGYFGKPRLNTALQLLLTTEEIGKNMHEVALPLLVLHGAHDVVTSPELSRELYRRASSTDKTLRIYDGAWHGLTAGEPDDMANRVVADMIAWLGERCPLVSAMGLSHQAQMLEDRKASWQEPMVSTSLEDDAQSSVTTL